VAFTEYLSVFLADFGVPVSFSGSTAGMLGIEDAQGLLVLEGEQFPGVQATDRTVLIETSEKGALGPGSAITVNGTARTVRHLDGRNAEMRADPDGAFTLVSLR
jgi:hypothetical protein